MHLMALHPCAAQWEQRVSLLRIFCAYFVVPNPPSFSILLSILFSSSIFRPSAFALPCEPLNDSISFLPQGLHHH